MILLVLKAKPLSLPRTLTFDTHVSLGYRAGHRTEPNINEASITCACKNCNMLTPAHRVSRFPSPSACVHTHHDALPLSLAKDGLCLSSSVSNPQQTSCNRGTEPATCGQPLNSH